MQVGGIVGSSCLGLHYENPIQEFGCKTNETTSALSIFVNSC